MLRGADLVVNATPFGDPSMPGVSPIPDGASLESGAVMFDLVYRPRRTPLLERAAAEGLATVEGIEMLIEQGARSFELWTGMPAPTEVMRRAAYRAYDADEDPAARRRRPASSTGRPLMLRFLTAGESHGPELVVIVEGMPAGRRGAPRGASTTSSSAGSRATAAARARRRSSATAH